MVVLGEMQEQQRSNIESFNWLVIVPPFACQWLVEEEFKFREAGRGCIAFEAYADNDITLVFKEQAGSEHYHYRRDNTPNYTIVLGSHRNRRLKIEVDGVSVVDMVGIGLCSASGFESYWISIYDGLITIGKGGDPGHNVMFQWLDKQPKSKVQYVGLSSWDKHVGYRNIRLLPSPDIKSEQKELGEEEGFGRFLESWDLADLRIVVGPEGRIVPAHKVVLAFCCGGLVMEEGVIILPSVEYPTLHALLQYLYPGRTQVSESQLEALRKLSEEFGVESLVVQCQQMKDAFKNTSFREDHKLEILNSNVVNFLRNHLAFSADIPIDVQKLKHFFQTGDYSDVDIYIEGHGLVTRAHKLVLSVWSAPFAKMFTNGMSESNCSEVCLGDVSPEALLAMLEFMYSGQLNFDEKQDMGSVLLPLVLLADQFGVYPLREECCEYLLESLSEDSVCPILQVVSSMAGCRPLEESCEEYFSKHFDYCTNASTGFRMLEEASFMRIIQHPDLVVTSEERVLDAVLTWGSQEDSHCGWETINEHLGVCTSATMFGQKLQPLDGLLPLVRFPLMPLGLLQKLEQSNLSKQIPVFEELITEALLYLKSDSVDLTNEQKQQSKALEINKQSRLSTCMRFHHRPTSFKELLYICDGDRNGVIYYAGTSYGEHTWMNPVLTKNISVTASSPMSRFTDAKALASRKYQATSFAGPQLEDGKLCAWWKVDLEKGHKVCNYSSHVQLLHTKTGWLNGLYSIMEFAGFIGWEALDRFATTYK
ncbi:BTB/POZ domain-containing protein At2g30600 isoform X2 [Cryptomeria japonica]|uniref:BTB/POZ domain-containing protein At2g30600 isoform X2 n=1 Tax=Cryptomeria japonica TaxID=3369 RepID=UPI0027DA8ABC|nr:BTB/POZ domain-containing protein At2g30600 isoform X2 [Cryptomeria japonica]